jgi:hypothetical protein
MFRGWNEASCCARGRAHSGMTSFATTGNFGVRVESIVRHAKHRNGNVPEYFRRHAGENRADFLFTVANKLWFAQWRRGDFHDFLWEHRSSNFFENFPCHHNR